MIGKNKLHNEFAGSQDSHGMGMNDHSFLAAGGTGRGKIATSFHLDHAESAGSGVVVHACAFEVQIAQCRYVYSRLPAGIEDCSAGSYVDGMVVYCDCHNFDGFEAFTEC